MIFKYIEEEEHTQSTELAAGRAGHDRQRHLDGDLPLVAYIASTSESTVSGTALYCTTTWYSTDAITLPSSREKRLSA